MRIPRSLIIKAGFTNEHEFWEFASTTANGSTLDHMISTLQARGFSGGHNDMLRDWAFANGSGSDAKDCIRVLSNKSTADIKTALEGVK